MDLREAILQRRTSNGYFRPDPVSLEHQYRLMEAASRAPSHFNSQPWRFVLITDPEVRGQVAALSGQSLQEIIAEGHFLRRYGRYFRFEAHKAKHGDGILVDRVPAPLRPVAKRVFSETGRALLNTAGVPRTIGEDNAELVRNSPLLLAALLTRDEYRPGELSAFYSVLGLGMAIENIWLTTVELGMGIQFISAPMEVPLAWRKLQDVLQVPEELELMAVYRLGYLPEVQRRATIDWVSSHRKRLSEYVFRDTCQMPEPEPGAS